MLRGWLAFLNTLTHSGKTFLLLGFQMYLRVMVAAEQRWAIVYIIETIL